MSDTQTELTRHERNSRGKGKGFSGCSACGDTWDWKPSHSTEFSNGDGCFPLCEECWAKLTPAQRLPHYSRLIFGVWRDPSLWPEVEAAVLAGK